MNSQLFMKQTLLILLILVSSTQIYAQSILGKWKTVDDQTGKAKSIVHIYKENNKFCGRIIDIINVEAKKNLCEGCSGKKKDKPIMGMVIFNTLEKNGNVYSGGKILDPGGGSEYTCKIWIDEEHPNVLNVRGYIAFFFRTQHWIRIEG